MTQFMGWTNVWVTGTVVNTVVYQIKYILNMFLYILLFIYVFSRERNNVLFCVFWQVSYSSNISYSQGKTLKCQSLILMKFFHDVFSIKMVAHIFQNIYFSKYFWNYCITSRECIVVLFVFFIWVFRNWQRNEAKEFNKNGTFKYIIWTNHFFFFFGKSAYPVKIILLFLTDFEMFVKINLLPLFQE